MRLQIFPGRAPTRIVEPLVRPLAALGISPHTISALGLGGNLMAAILVAHGELLAGGIVMLIASALDSLDGALARLTGRTSRVGALLDATFDRLSEAAVLGGVLYYEIGLDHREESLLAFAALAGSMLVSYVRARGEAEGVLVTSGPFARTERVLVLAAGLLTGWLRSALWLLAVLSLLTAIHRLILSTQALRENEISKKESQ